MPTGDDDSGHTTSSCPLWFHSRLSATSSSSVSRQLSSHTHTAASWGVLRATYPPDMPLGCISSRRGELSTWRRRRSRLGTYRRRGSPAGRKGWSRVAATRTFHARWENHRPRRRHLRLFPAAESTRSRENESRPPQPPPPAWSCRPPQGWCHSWPRCRKQSSHRR